MRHARLATPPTRLVVVPHRALPLKEDVSFAFALTWLVAALLIASSMRGLFHGWRSWYDPAPAVPALLGQDLVTLFVAVPFLIDSMRRARRGSTRGLLCWMGALFYIAYFSYFYVVGIGLDVFFPVHIALTSMSMYGLLALFFALDLRTLQSQFDGRTPTRLIGGFLIASALGFGVMWLVLTISALAAGRELDQVSRLVIAIDGVVLLPLTFVGGVWLWRRLPLGYALAGVLLVKLAATFLTLVASSATTWLWGQTLDAMQTSAYAVGMVCALALEGPYLRSVKARKGAET
ncbi:MAG TPA: hypothetical protein VHI98_23115 [Vicinamibacterales bacterium]|jgi:hypothetical protein|nr:hypothetical protein [Vicinamibacterales bacterium]